MSSILWSLWLCAPEHIYYIVYSHFIGLFGKQLYSAHVTRLPVGLYIKFGDTSESLLKEAVTTQYVHRSTTIPVPAILDFIKPSNQNCRPLLLMSEVPGHQLGSMPLSLNNISQPQLMKFHDMLGDWLNQLRNLSRPIHNNTVSSISGSAFSSYHLSFTSSVGPYESVKLFHAQDFCKLHPNASPTMQSLAASLRQKTYCLYLTHGDLSPSNILVNDNYKPVGLVDFQCTAWMPEYWEFTSAVWHRQRYMSWFKLLQEIHISSVRSGING